ncbi:hypothetical protein F2Q65_12045 [Thiohalocapsa marina]|uniref:Uncharacterized protein n=1 Tax=Thiohalocapsa marina TaxID=424902 RepID=A0A5M8FJ89_9GAMM|nr:hypothetical protein [Thiohalocapsa marina]KAA6184564.1 hypothetical protein F2Q65_12045 [Thiohalocapsa marina]
MLFNCRSMRLGVLLSLALLASGFGLGLLTMAVPLMMPFSPLALLLVLAAALVLALVFVDAALPDADHRLDGCRH